MDNIIIKEIENTEDNAKLIMEWRNDKITRQMSFNSELKIWNEFKEIFKNDYFNNYIKPLFAYYNDNKIAFIGFLSNNNDKETNSEVSKISINISPEYRNKKLGKIIINKSIEYVKNKYPLIKKIIAEIKLNNIASYKLFKSCNFIYDGIKKFNDIDILVYHYNIELNTRNVNHINCKNFTKIDANNWFNRNKDKIQNTNLIDIITKQYFNNYIDKNKKLKILEIGCGNGFRLSEIQKYSNHLLTGIDLSEKAINEGKNNYPYINFIFGDINDIALTDTYDVIICGFFLYYIAQQNLDNIINKINKNLNNNGKLIIIDFYSKNYVEKNCIHRENLIMHKMDHSKLFTNNLNYILLSRNTILDDCNNYADSDINRYVTIDLLHKY